MEHCIIFLILKQNFFKVKDKLRRKWQLWPKNVITQLDIVQILYNFISALVLGDILNLQTGDVVPADCRILEASDGFMVDNSAITGESEPIELDATATHEKQLFSRNMAFFSACVVQGRARAVVTRTVNKLIFTNC